jgi:hypothetical protein
MTIPIRISRMWGARPLVQVEPEFWRAAMDDITRSIITRGDLAHLALFLWASGASALLIWSLKELAAANRRFDDFVREIASLNQLFKRRD